MKALECSQHFSHCKTMETLKGSQLRSPWSNFELVREFKDGLVTCKNEEDPIKKAMLFLVICYNGIIEKI